MSEPTWRVGNHQPQNIYRDGEYVGIMSSASLAAAIAEVLNQLERPMAAELRAVRAIMADDESEAFQALADLTPEVLHDLIRGCLVVAGMARELILAAARDCPPLEMFDAGWGAYRVADEMEKPQ